MKIRVLYVLELEKDGILEFLSFVGPSERAFQRDNKVCQSF